MRATSYRISLRGEVPTDLGEKLAQAHAAAVLATKKLTRDGKPAADTAGQEARCVRSDNPPQVSV